MNFHSMMVHFPIALLVIYSLFEVIGFRSAHKYVQWFYVKATFLIVGVLTAFPALTTGGMLENSPKYDEQILDLHESFASASTNFFGVIAVIYLLAFFYRNAKLNSYINSYKTLPEEVRTMIHKITRYASIIISSPVVLLTAIIGILLLSITGGLGGILSSGLGVDPIADFFYSLFSRYY